MEQGGMGFEGDMPEDAVLDACRELAMAAMAMDDAPVDVESRLRAFDRRHRHRRMRLLWAAVAAVACVALMVAIWPRHRQPDLSSSPIAYTEVRNLKGVTIVGQKGRKVEQKVATAEAGGVFDVLSADESDVVLTAAVPSGSSYEMRLADGTRVIMHSNSRLVFPSRFTGDKREVRLDGEAYFVVAHDAAHPFVVHGGRMETEVLGTEFYARAYGRADDDVTLVSGRLRVSAGAGSALLRPGQKAFMRADGTMLTVTADITPLEYWRDGYLFYDHTTLRDIIESIAADNAYTVDYKTQEHLDREMHFVAERTQGVDAVLQTLSDITGITMRAVGARIVVGREA